MSAVDRAAEARDTAAAMIAMVWADIGETTAEILAWNVVKALADAGLLVTDEIRAVLDTAKQWRQYSYPFERGELEDAVDAYLASRPT